MKLFVNKAEWDWFRSGWKRTNNLTDEQVDKFMANNFELYEPLPKDAPR